jgi:hypothetical protein
MPYLCRKFEVDKFGSLATTKKNAKNTFPFPFADKP